MLEDYKILVRHFHMVGTGAYKINRRGNRVEVLRGESSFLTAKCGELRESEWISRVQQEVQREHKQELLLKIEQHCRKQCCWIKESDIPAYALECLAGRAYESWENFYL